MVVRKKEGPTQSKAVDYAATKRVRTIRMYFGPGIQTGWPDVLFLIPGGFPCFIEFKATGKTPTKKQWRKIKYLRDDGYNAWWTDDLDEAKDMIDLALEGRDVKDGRYIQEKI